MKPAFALLPALALFAAAPAFAETPSGPAASPPMAGEPVAGRYQFQSIDGGLARLDTATGEIAICRVDPVLMACDFARRAADGAVGDKAKDPPPRASGEAADDAEFERALGRMQRLLRAFGDIAREPDPDRPAPLPNRT